MYSGKYGREPLCCKRKRVWIVAVFFLFFFFLRERERLAVGPGLNFATRPSFPFSKRRGRGEGWGGAGMKARFCWQGGGDYTVCKGRRKGGGGGSFLNFWEGGKGRREGGESCLCGLTENVSEECVEGGKDLLFPEMKSSTLDFPTLFRTLQFEAAFVSVLTFYRCDSRAEDFSISE